MNSLEVTGYCWHCGLPCKDLFCNTKHRKAYERKQASYNARKNMVGKRAGYGVKGSMY